jgi:hypothetical protein
MNQLTNRPVSERGIPVECSLGFGRGAGTRSIGVSIIGTGPRAESPDYGNVPRIYDALARELFNVTYADLTYGQAFTISSLPPVLSEVRGSNETECPTSVVANGSEVYVNFGCQASFYTRTYQDGSSLSITIVVMFTDEPLGIGFEPVSALADLIQDL